MKKVLVLCTGNSCRSQMMHGYLNHFGKGNVSVKSAGIETHGVNPKAISVMEEDGVNISNHTSNNMDEYLNETFDFLISVCDHAKETCPVFPSMVKHIHFTFEDPAKAEGSKEEVLQAFRNTRDQIKAFSYGFISAIF